MSLIFFIDKSLVNSQTCFLVFSPISRRPSAHWRNQAASKTDFTMRLYEILSHAFEGGLFCRIEEVQCDLRCRIGKVVSVVTPKNIGTTTDKARASEWENVREGRVMSELAIRHSLERYVAAGKLTRTEASWLSKLLEPDFANKDVLVEQIGLSVINRTIDLWHYDLTFDYESNEGPKFSSEYGSPVSMQVMRNDLPPVLFTLLVWDWRIDQLLVQSAGGGEVDFDHLDLSDALFE